MGKNYLLLIIVLIIAAVLSNVTYADVFMEGDTKEGLTLLKEFANNPSFLSRLIILQILFPLVFTIETFLIKYPFSKEIRVIFILQSILAAVGIFFLHLLMTLHVFEHSSQHDFNTYIIIIFESVFILWSLLLGIPYANKIKMLNFNFHRKHNI